MLGRVNFKHSGGLFNSALLITVALSAAAESHDDSHSLSHTALETVGLQSLVNDPDQRFVLYRVSGLPEFGFTLNVASASAFVELSFDLEFNDAVASYRVSAGDVTVSSVSCNGRRFPGNNIVGNDRSTESFGRTERFYRSALC